MPPAIPVDEPETKPRRQSPWLFLTGAGLAVTVAFLPGVADLPDAARATAAVAFLTAWCWLFEALPLPIASLLPAFLLPATGVAPAREVAPWYFQDILLLFLGGFILALALERYGLERRFARRALLLFGTRPRRVVLGFMLTCALLSMFISNTSTALLMLPVALALLHACSEEEGRALQAPLLLGIAYSCSIGGLATPIGTAPNSVLLGITAERFPDAPEIGFGTWFIGAFPLTLAFLFFAWFVLVYVVSRLPSGQLDGLGVFLEGARAHGPRSPEQSRVLGVFLLVALLWMTRQGFDFGSFRIPGWRDLLPPSVQGTLADSTVALLGVVLLFLLPGQGRRGTLLDWEDCRDLPWGVLLLLGGGFALARAFTSSGLSTAIGDGMSAGLEVLPLWGTVLLLCLTVTFLTEITSNTATINILLPLLFSAAVAGGIHPMALAIPLTFSVSCAFMLPVATPPNAILFSSGRLDIRTMARHGVILNLATAVLVTLLTFAWIAPRWGFDLDVFPDWAR